MADFPTARIIAVASILLAGAAASGCGAVLVTGAATKTAVGAGKLAVKTGAGAVKLTAKGVIGLAEEEEKQDF